MKNLYFLKFLACFSLLLNIANANAQRYGSNLNNPIQVGNITAGNPYSDTQNNSPSNGFGNDFGQSSDDIFTSSQ